MQKRTTESELNRIKDVYQGYGPGVAAWDSSNPGNELIARDLNERIGLLLERYSLLPLKSLKILDVGCGHGGYLGLLKSFGAESADLTGIDLMSDRIEAARRRYPDIALQVANAEDLPFEAGSFDLVLLFTVFSSILSSQMRANIAAEVDRVLKPGGAIIWYDMRYPSPANRNVRPIRYRDLREAFPGFAIELEAVTLMPPVARRLPRMRASRLYSTLASVPPLRTHYLGLLRRATLHSPDGG